MNREILESRWLQIRQILKEKFSNLSEEDIQQINGHYDQLVVKLQQKYGYSREEAEERIRNWNFDRFETPRVYQSEPRTYNTEEKTVIKERSRSSFNWLLWLGLPLLLLGSYYLGTRAPEMARTSPVITQDRMMVETPADRLISTDLRNALLAQPDFAFAMQNVDITTHDGVVTLSGFVPSADMRNSIVDTAKNFAGVKHVVNNLEVK